MKRFIKGVDRSQSTLFPEKLEDFIAEDNPVRVIDAFVDELDLRELGFEGVNNLARDTGVVQGSVTNMMTGKGRFNFVYKSETYTGEATRVSDDERRGVASAYSPRGGYMSCEYQMNNPRQGAGNCSFSDGAEYQMHVGN